MTDEQTGRHASDAEVEEPQANFPSPDDFDSYDEVDSDEGQAELPDDSFNEAAASDEEPTEGCCA